MPADYDNLVVPVEPVFDWTLAAQEEPPVLLRSRSVVRHAFDSNLEIDNETIQQALNSYASACKASKKEITDTMRQEIEKIVDERIEKALTQKGYILGVVPDKVDPEILFRSGDTDGDE